MDEFKLVTGCKGYVTKIDKTLVDENYLVAGSQNMIINDEGGLVETRGGISIFGATNSTTTPPKSEHVWKHSQGTQIMLREANGTLEFYSEDSDAWETLLTGLSATYPVRFAPIWDTTELIDILLFVNHSTTLYQWGGGLGTYASSTLTTIVINETIADRHFLTAGTRLIRVKDSGGTWREFTVSSQTGSTFTVAEDPTAFTFSANALVVQSVRTSSNVPASTFTNDVIKVLQNQAIIGSHSSRRIYISKNTSYTDYTFSSPRIIGEGVLATLDDITVGLEIDDSNNQAVFFSGGNRIYRGFFEVSPGSTADRENFTVKPLLVGEGQGAMSQELITKIKQAIVWLSNDNELVKLGQVQNLPSPQAVSISDPIKNDFVNASFTNGSLKLWRSNLIITAPPDSKVFIFDLAKRYWQPPQIMGVRLLSVYNELLYGHSNSILETYELFTGVNDNGNPIAFKAHFAYRNHGDRAVLKNFDKYYTEMYIASNTTVTVKLLFEYGGSKTIKSYDCDGSIATFLSVPNVSASLGVNSLGVSPLGSIIGEPDDLNKYRRYKPTDAVDYHEFQARFETDGDDAQFALLSHGPNAVKSQNSAQKLYQ